MMIALVLAAAVLASLCLTSVIRRYALRRGILDVPSERSSHSEPMPRGGGMAIVVAFVFCASVLYVHGLLPDKLFAALIGAGGWIALVGFLDDHVRVSAIWRFLAHCVGAAWTVYCL